MIQKNERAQNQLTGSISGIFKKSSQHSLTRRSFKWSAPFVLLTALLVIAGRAPAQPIRLHPANPHYFQWRNQPTVLITSAEHYGAVINLDFNYIPYLNELQARGLNLTRIFTGTYIETPGSFGISGNTLAPAANRLLVPWARSNSGGYAAGGNKFDLSRWDSGYFNRLRDFCSQASQRGIVVEVVLFCGYYSDGLWNISPLKSSNNINGIGTVAASATHSMNNGNLLTAQELYVRKMAAELKDFDNIYFEICNEPYFNGVTTDWQNHMVNVLVEAESTFPNKHLIAMNIANGSGVIPNPHPKVSVFNFHYARPPDAVAQNYALNRVIGFDETGFDGSQDTTYRLQAWDFLVAGGAVFNNLDFSFTVGQPNGTASYSAPGGGGVTLRSQLKILRDFMNSFNFVNMTPDNGLVRGSHPVQARGCSQNRAWAMRFMRGGIQANVTLAITAGSYRAEWINTKTGNIDKSEEFTHAGGNRTIASPNYSDDMALRVKSTAPPKDPPAPDPNPTTGWTFYRGINLNGNPTEIDGKQWDGSTAPHYSFTGGSFANYNVALNPPTDANRARMIGSSIWNGSGANVSIQSVPQGTYNVYLYVWEDNNPVTYSIYLNGSLVKANHNSGSAGTWHKLGPWPVSVNNGSISISCSAGDANLSGVEIWRGGALPLNIRRIGNGQHQISFPSEVGRTYQVQCSTDLKAWSHVANVTANGGTTTYTDASGRTHCFFRVLLP